MQLLPIQRALISVTDKSSLQDLGTCLQQAGAEIVSTGGTMRALQDLGFTVTSVRDVTGFPEIMGGRVKTLHPNIHAGILADKDNPEHIRTLQETGIRPFDLICVNLYDFDQALQKNLKLPDLIEEIDIGGPTLLRAGAKNFHSVAVLPSTEFYSRFKQELSQNHNQVSLEFRQEMAAYTFGLISEYDRMVASALKG
ncbi:MAG: IMP cyclohydrolase [Desulfohalobiaceae bacterium]